VGLADQVRLVCESLIESELGEVTLLLDGLLARYYSASLSSKGTKACCTLPTELLIVVPLACLCTMLLRLGGLGRLAYILCQKPEPMTGSNGLIMLDAVSTSLTDDKRLLCLSIWASHPCRATHQTFLSSITNGVWALRTRSPVLVVQLPRQTRSLQEALVLMLVNIVTYSTLAYSVTSGLARHSTNVARRGWIQRFLVAFRGLSPTYYHFHV